MSTVAKIKMLQLGKTKKDILKQFENALTKVSADISRATLSKEEKARQINASANEIRSRLKASAGGLPAGDQANYALVLQYCFSVASLEYRHAVWPYEYMAFSRRVGELWEGFCSAAWDHPSRRGVKRIPTPSFGSIKKILSARIDANIGSHGKRTDILEDVSTLFEIIGDINMKEDEVFSVNEVPHVIDFKSGFGSNEKGNMLRLQTVGRAYRLWDHRTKLFLLVRQKNNNNYLNVLRRAGLWTVLTGEEAYSMISELTGADINLVREEVIDWQADLSREMRDYLRDQPRDLSGYLDW